MTQKTPPSPDRRTDAFYFVDGKRFSVSLDGRNKALQVIEKAGFSEHDSIVYLNLLDHDYLKQRIS